MNICRYKEKYYAPNEYKRKDIAIIALGLSIFEVTSCLAPDLDMYLQKCGKGPVRSFGYENPISIRRDIIL